MPSFKMFHWKKKRKKKTTQCEIKDFFSPQYLITKFWESSLHACFKSWPGTGVFCPDLGSSSSNCSWSRTEGKTTTTAVAAVLGMNDVADAPEFDLRRERAPSEGSIRSSRSYSHTHSYSGVSGPRHLVHVPPELSGSRRSCLTTNGELFVDIMWPRLDCKLH